MFRVVLIADCNARKSTIKKTDLAIYSTLKGYPYLERSSNSIYSR